MVLFGESVFLFLPALRLDNNAHLARQQPEHIRPRLTSILGTLRGEPEHPTKICECLLELVRRRIWDKKGDRLLKLSEKATPYPITSKLCGHSLRLLPWLGNGLVWRCNQGPVEVTVTGVRRGLEPMCQLLIAPHMGESCSQLFEPSPGLII